MKYSRETLKLSDDMKAGFTMPIVAMGAPTHSCDLEGYKTPDYINDFCFTVIEDGGVNLINCLGLEDKEQLDEIIELADKHHIGVCNAECNIEPLGENQKLTEYEKYLRDFCTTHKPKYLSYINPLYSNIYGGKMSREEAKKNFLSNAIIVSKIATEFGIPFWGNVQAGGDFEGGTDAREYYPDHAEILWMVNIYLAVGAKGIQYYPLIQKFSEAIRADGTIDHDRGGILGADGLPTVYWSYIRTANEQIKSVGSMLLQCKNETVLATGDTSEYINSVLGTDSDKVAFRQLVSVESSEKGVTIGCLDFKNITGFYVVNNDLYTRREVTLNFDTPQTVVISQIGSNKTEKNQEKATLSLPEGGAAFVFLWKRLGD